MFQTRRYRWLFTLNSKINETALDQHFNSIQWMLKRKKTDTPEVKTKNATTSQSGSKKTGKRDNEAKSFVTTRMLMTAASSNSNKISAPVHLLTLQEQKSVQVMFF